MENNVTSLDTAKKLKAAGFEISNDEPIFGWQNYEATWIILPWADIDEDMEWYLAPTAQEIADQLPTLRDGEKGTYSLTVHMSPVGTGWQACYSLNSKSPHHHWLDVLERADGKTMADALAALWLKLHETLPSNNGQELAKDTDVKP